MIRRSAPWALGVLLAGCATSGPPARSGAEENHSSRTPRAAPSQDDGNDDERSIFLSMLLTEAVPGLPAWVKASGDDQEFASRLDLTLVTTHQGDFGEVSHRHPSFTLKNGELHVGSPLSGASRDAVTDAHLASTFLIDFEEPSLEEPARALEQRHGTAPSAEQIEAFTSEYIEDKTHARDFDIASQVAANRSGDCTEHAVLLVALLRRFKIPARVVLGLALIGVNDAVVSVGHAWVEYHTGNEWRHLDAALYVPAAGEDGNAHGVPGLPEGATFRRVYLPLQVMSDEGIGYTAALMQGFGLWHVQTVRVGLLDTALTVSKH